jgi:hypothetical protein
MKILLFISVFANALIGAVLWPSYSLYKERYTALQQELLKKGYAEWKLDQEYYPPINVFTLK